MQCFPDPVDLALLQFEAAETLACVELDGAIAAFDDLFAYGYPDITPNGAGVVLRCDGLNGDVPPKIKFSDGRVRSGLSGAPLLNPATGKVCGVVKYTEDRSLPLGGGGIPIATVLEYFPVLNTPYKGLAYFKDDDARFFFGRTALTDLLLDRLQQSNFLALLGASGSGKSSVLRAGLLNQLRQERLSGSDRWELRVMLPTEHPLKRLANEFVDQKLGNIDRAAQLATAEKLLAEGKDGLRRLVEATAKSTRMVLVIDQFEESFTLTQFRGCPDPEFNLKWKPNSSNSDLLILLTHYNPLQNIKKSLSMTEREMREFLQKNNGLPSQYQSQIILFKDEIDTLSKRFGIDTCKMADESDVIICCWGEFMESPYKEKHIFQGTSRGKVFITPYPKYTQVQCTYSWD